MRLAVTGLGVLLGICLFIAPVALVVYFALGRRALLRCAAFVLLLGGAVVVTAGALALFRGPPGVAWLRPGVMTVASGVALMAAAVVLDRFVQKAIPRPQRGFEIPLARRADGDERDS